MKIFALITNIVAAQKRVRQTDEDSRTLSTTGTCFNRQPSDQCYWGRNDYFWGCSEDTANNGTYF